MSMLCLVAFVPHSVNDVNSFPPPPHFFRKMPVNVVGKPRRTLRRSPPQHVSRDERERLVDMATKLIVATVRRQNIIIIIISVLI